MHTAIVGPFYSNMYGDIPRCRFCTGNVIYFLNVLHGTYQIIEDEIAHESNIC